MNELAREAKRLRHLVDGAVPAAGPLLYSAEQ
jgi:hypothetical protein